MIRRDFLGWAIAVGMGETSLIANAEHTSFTVAVCGDKAARIVASQLRQRGVHAIEGKLPNTNSRVAIIAQNATTGPMPIHVTLARQFRAFKKLQIIWMITNLSDVVDEELLILEVLMANEILAKHRIPISRQRIAFDATATETIQKCVLQWFDSEPLMGWESCSKYLKQFDKCYESK